MVSKSVFQLKKKPLGTGGAIKKIKNEIHGKSFLVMNGDVVTDINLKEMMKTTNTVAGIELRTQFGTLGISKNKINSFEEKKTTQRYLDECRNIPSIKRDN